MLQPLQLLRTLLQHLPHVVMLSVTFVGSTIPASNMFTHSFVAALNPTPGSAFFKRSTITEPSSPAFSAIWRTGAVKALSTIFTPVSISPSASISLTFATFTNAVPPPATIPLLQLHVEFNASSIRNLRS